MTAEISVNPWATLDDLWGIEVAMEAVDDRVWAVAFYGRCSTEDNQDPETSYGWQVGNARKFVEPLGGEIVEDFFDVGKSRSVPWERRDEASRLLAALKDPNRKWNAVVVGEGTRCWFGNQFSLIAPKFAAYGVDLWVPELGGKYDPRNPSHKMLMSVLGGMSESERQHVQARVRAAMDSQVVNEGRHQGGRAAYGYTVVDGGPHPNPRKAAEGFRLRVLAIDEPAAEVVRRIFREYLQGKGDRAIAKGLNEDGILCPSARRPEQNRHRQADGWQGSTVRSILENPKYTGYAFFGRWTRQEMLLDPDDVSAGHVVRFRRAPADKVVRSRRPAHPEIVSVEDFTLAQVKRQAKSAGGLRTARKTERAGRTTKHTYFFRGLIRCSVCKRKMEGSPRAHGMYYRCPARTLAPGSPALVDHPPTVYVREDPLLEAVNEWLGGLFHPKNRDRTVRMLVGSQERATPSGDREQAAKRASDAEAKLRRFQAAIGAGVDPAALVEVINQAQAERAAARAELDNAPTEGELTDAEVYAMLDSMGDVASVLTGKHPEKLIELYADLQLNLLYDNEKEAIDVMASPRVNSACVRGGT
ncbi:recombinase family protein [Kibdelosporangium philippinense]|uniref:Recombinase family protein n=1 Tax=Kibdelosporangium philippinense TaxID=211113 RepID=A0ABS8Z625_9PSEU|nr:recombinase family protein [Kibdelosporangium philippinense]MCE7003260.1 recombinase family protein [Kibdelosporangium philippinense]